MRIRGDRPGALFVASAAAALWLAACGGPSAPTADLLITGGDWGAYAEWEQGSTGESGADRGGGEGADAGRRDLRPTRSLIDSITPETPVLLSRWDGEVYLANGAALEAAGADCPTEGVECEDGAATGRLTPAAAERIREAIPERSMERRIAEADTAFDRLLAAGVTTIHDVTPASQLRVFGELQRRDSLEVRIYARPILDDWDQLRAAGIRLSFGSDWPGTNAAWYPTSPVKGIYATVTRKTLSGEPEGGWLPEERVSVETALRAYTVNNAWAEGREESKGSIEPGKLADLVVLDRSPLRVPADSIGDLEVLYTIVEGRVAHEGP